MPLTTAGQARVHRMHGVRFVSYASPELGSGELCAWRLEVPARACGAEHTVTREEVFFALEGMLELRVDGEVWPLEPGDAATVPAGSRLGLANPAEAPAAAWVASSVGLRALLDDGTLLSPPWTR